MLFVLWDEWHKRRLSILGQGVKVDNVDYLDNLVEVAAVPVAKPAGTPGRAEQIAAFIGSHGGEVTVDGP